MSDWPAWPRSGSCSTGRECHHVIARWLRTVLCAMIFLCYALSTRASPVMVGPRNIGVFTPDRSLLIGQVLYVGLGAGGW